MHTLQNQVKSKVRIKAHRQKLNCHFKKYSIRTETITVKSKLRIAAQAKIKLSFPLALRRQRRRATSSLARRLARHVLVRPLKLTTEKNARPFIDTWARYTTMVMYTNSH